MATPTLTGMTVINNADATTGWTNIGGGPGLSLNNDIFIEGTGSISRRVDGSIRGYAYDVGVGNELDFSSGGANEFDTIFFWVNILQPAAINSMQLRLSISTTSPGADWVEWRIFPDNIYNGGWYRVAVSPGRFRHIPAERWDSIRVSVDLSSVRWIAFVFDMQNVGGTSPNCLIDAIHIGKGLTVTGGTSGDRVTWKTLADADAASSFGIIQERSGVFFATGRIEFGDGTNNLFFDDIDSIIVWEPKFVGINFATPETIEGTNFDFNKISFNEGTGTVDFINGIKSGTGDNAVGTNGCLYQAALSPVAGLENRVTFDFSGTITNIELFGTSFKNILGTPFSDASLIFSSDVTDGPNHEISGCIFDSCGIIDAGRTSMQNNVFANTHQQDQLTKLINSQVFRNIAGTWDDVTTAAANVATNDIQPFITADNNVGDAWYFGAHNPITLVKFFAEKHEITEITVGNSIWEYWNGTAWTAVTGLTTTVTNGDWLFEGKVEFDLPTDWERTIVNGSARLFFVRARITTDFNTVSPDPIWGYAVAELSNGAALRWNTNIDIVNSTFGPNADADSKDKAHGIEHTVEGTVSYNGLVFTGNDADILLTDESTLVDNYDFSNGDTDQTIGNGTITGIAQSITGDGNVLSQAKFNLKKTLLPTGNAVAKLYAHSGTFGTSSVPTGAALATSANFDVSTLTTSYIKTVFDFLDAFTLVNTTKYVITVEYSGGDSSNHVQVESDSSSPTHGGNLAENTGSWAANSGRDLVFEVWADILTINASGGADPVSSTITHNGQVIINNTINVELTGLIASPPTEVRVYDAGTTDEIDGEENVTTGSFTFQANASDVVDIRIHNVEFEYTTILNFTVPSSDTSIPIQQRFDRNYSNP